MEVLVEMAEGLHKCPPETIDPDGAASYGRSRIIRYSPK
jgi:hypothetical protein